MRVLVWASVLSVVLGAGSAFAQGNSGCSGTIQGGAGQAACNAYGLCKAFFAGSENGRSHKQKAGPFQALIEASCGMCDEGCECDASNNGDGSSCNDDTDECVAMFCPDTNPGGHGRNPSDGSPGQHK
jgi:hypothetical protein